MVLVAHGNGLLRPLFLVFVVKERESKQGAGCNYVGSAIDGKAFERRSRPWTALDFIKKDERVAGNEPEIGMNGTYRCEYGVGTKVVAKNPCVVFIDDEVEGNVGRIVLSPELVDYEGLANLSCPFYEEAFAAM